MRAVTFEDGAVVVADRDALEPGPGEVLVSTRAAGLNGADMLQRRGRYPAPRGAVADVPGLEFAGEVAAVGAGAPRFAVGDRVMGITGGGGQASQVVEHERILMPVPNELSWDQAGGFAEVATTAHDALCTQAGLRPGERVLVTGAAGGVGTAAVQIAAALGAHVVASVRNTGAHDAVAALGAHEVVEPDAVADHGPYDVVLELVGAVNLDTNLRNLATGGRIVVIGIGAGAKAEINLALLLGTRGRILGSTLRARPLEEKALTARAVEREVLPWVVAGQFTVPVDATFDIEDASAAYDHFTAGGKLGKVVLTIS